MSQKVPTGAASAASDPVLSRVEDGVAIISLNRPERHNAFDELMVEQFYAAFRRAQADDSVRCLLLRGEGRSFSSGRDTRNFSLPRDESPYGRVRAHQDSRLSQYGARKPCVAALHGHVLGAGCEIALAADVRICADDTRLALPEVRFGIMPDTGGVALSTILAGPSRAKWLVLTGDTIDAQRALSWGLVDDVVPLDELDAVAGDLAIRIAAGPPLANAMIKQVVDEVWQAAFHAGMRAELLASTTLFASADHDEAMAARAEGRAPKYRGR